MEELLRIIEEHQQKKVSTDLKKYNNISISASTVRNRLHDIGLYGRVARKKPYISKENRSRRVKWAKDLLNSQID